jgi:hypothetical protein
LQSTVAILGTTAFLAITTHFTLGGNVLSSVVGEYSYALSLVFTLLYLAALQQTMRGAQRIPHMGVLLAAAALSHLVPTMFAVAASCSAFRSAQARRSVVAGWLLGFGLAAFWAVPFLVRSRYMGRIEWPFTLDPAQLLPWPILAVMPWTAAGAIMLWRSGARPGSFALMGAAAGLACLVPHTLFSPQRALPIAHLSLYLLTGLGIGAGLRRSYASGSRVHLAGWAGGILVLAGVVVLQIDFIRARSYMLLTSSTPDSAAYYELARTFAALPEGRLHAEHWTRGGGAVGDRLSPGRLPAFDPRIRTTIGLLRESALTSPAYYSLLKDQSWDTAFTFLRTYPAPVDSSAPARLARLRQLGVRYYVTFSPESRHWAAAQEKELREVASHPDWTIWHVAGANVVAPVRRVRAAGPADAYSTWLDELTDSTAWVLADPGDAGVRFPTPPAGRLPPVRNVTLEHRIVRFEAAALGVPHVVRVGFFPNWRAYGADGPYHVLPGFMLVVPRQTSVMLRFESTWVEWLGGSLTIGAFLVVLALIGRGLLTPARQAPNAVQAQE